ncbi:hypothetical protein J3459_014804, partial [Metarhizium acridum]
FGSAIGPASEHGLFGLRPTLGAVSTRGVFPRSRELDTVGFFTRTAKAATATIRAISNINIAKRFCSANTELCILQTSLQTGLQSISLMQSLNFQNLRRSST